MIAIYNLIELTNYGKHPINERCIKCICKLIKLHGVLILFFPRPSDLQVINERVHHLQTVPSEPEPFYRKSNIT